MAFEFTVVCDVCGQRTNVPSPEAFPMGWVQARYPAPSMTNGSLKPESKIVCGWKCMIKLASGFIREEVKP